jgi:cytochrome c peroxidase
MLVGALFLRDGVPDDARPRQHPSATALATAGFRSPAPRAAPPPQDDPRATIGKRIFFDSSLSVPEGTSCSTCHDPSHGYAGNRDSLGVPEGSRPGHFARRNTPSVLYLRFVRRFHMKWDDESEHPEPFGGFFWDGHADSIATLVREPIANPDEMNDPDPRKVAAKLAASPYAGDLRREFDGVFDSPEKALEAFGFCLEAFLTSREMSPFSSRFDDFVRGTADLTPPERRGLALFEDPDKGACNSCHRLDRSTGIPESALFTDYGYDVVAVPRNRKLRPNENPRAFDLGLCERRDKSFHTEDEWYCGSFRTPSLRNVALRTHFMHNGVFSSLREVVQFYATRSTDPERWYHGGVFDDLPSRYHPYVNTTLPPYNQLTGERPHLEEADIDAIVAFLETLTDRDIPAARLP